MLDFTSVLYLGLRHPSWSLRPWSQFTTGVPAALRTPCSAQVVAQRIATLQGCERGTLGTSTLHLFWDLFDIVARQGAAIYVDAGAYPIGRWGVERAAAHGVPVRSVPHYDPEGLRRLLKQDAPSRLRPIVLADGFCPGCGRPAPLADYLACVRERGGWLILDDTQALGIFGDSPGTGAPYGRGGGGMLPCSQLGGPDVLVVSSLAKGFGVPVAALAGCQAVVEEFEAQSETLVHCSPPSIATVHAAAHALDLNTRWGDTLRLRLAGLVNYFRCRMAAGGFCFRGGLFPVQTLFPSRYLSGPTLYQWLLKLGVRTVLHGARNGHGIRLSFVITNQNSRDEIDYAAEMLRQCGRGCLPLDWKEVQHEERTLSF